MNTFHCKVCKTNYSTAGPDVPPSVKWDDGHVCDLTPGHAPIKSLDDKINDHLEENHFLNDKQVYTEKDMDNAYDKGKLDADTFD